MRWPDVRSTVGAFTHAVVQTRTLMTSLINESAAQPRAESFVDWFHINSRIVTAGAVGVAAAAFGYWILEPPAYNETLSAHRPLLAAKQALNSRNAALAPAAPKKLAGKHPPQPA